MRVGTVVAGRYRVDRFVGAGGMGEVWAAQDTLLGRPVALKLMQDDGPSDRVRFLREAQAAAGLQHPGIVVVHDFGEQRTRPPAALPTPAPPAAPTPIPCSPETP
ncbi:protein kinase family protein [Kitasatospora aureofaciens]|uniref:hypothetical protein n=1 Tax=Kitasatospora aureofaciens TaxID=1894 RepID=UPI0036F4992B